MKFTVPLGITAGAVDGEEGYVLVGDRLTVRVVHVAELVSALPVTVAVSWPLCKYVVLHD